MRRIATIGVYGFTADAFLEKLTRANVGLLLDLRQHRGVRGADYSWANSVCLQRALGAVGTGYRHMRGLAPTTELRHLQYREDDRQCVGKRSRIVLAREYAERYTREILDRFDLDAVVPELPRNSVTALFIATAFVHSSHVRVSRCGCGSRRRGACGRRGWRCRCGQQWSSRSTPPRYSASDSRSAPRATAMLLRPLGTPLPLGFWRWREEPSSPPGSSWGGRRPLNGTRPPWS
ncbi:DUF488 family protein [Streptomyces sp. NPDC058746]|uniref:DUF488 family protein n=1 Tax=Streptomyces sp. NPDC058746 TaxID=3346622 RepID=UPI00367DB8BB